MYIRNHLAPALRACEFRGALRYSVFVDVKSGASYVRFALCELNRKLHNVFGSISSNTLCLDREYLLFIATHLGKEKVDKPLVMSITQFTNATVYGKNSSILAQKQNGLKRKQAKPYDAPKVTSKNSEYRGAPLISKARSAEVR